MRAPSHVSPLRGVRIDKAVRGSYTNRTGLFGGQIPLGLSIP